MREVDTKSYILSLRKYFLNRLPFPWSRQGAMGDWDLIWNYPQEGTKTYPTSTHTHTHAHTQPHPHTHTHPRTRTHPHTQTHPHIHTHTHTHTRTHTRMRTHTHTLTRTHMPHAMCDKIPLCVFANLLTKSGILPWAVLDRICGP